MHSDLPLIKATLATRRTKMILVFVSWVCGWKCLWHWERDGMCEYSSMTQRVCHSHTWFLLTEGHKTNQMEQGVQYCESESWVNLCVSADSDRVSSYILMLSWVRNNPFSSSGLRKGFLGHVFNKLSQPFMRIYRYCVHVIKPMQVTAFMCAREIWMLIFAKGKRMRPDLKTRKSMHLGPWFFSDLLWNFQTEAKHRSWHHHFVHTPQPCHTPWLLESSPSPCWLMWRCRLKCCLPKVSSKPHHHLTVSKEKAPQAWFVTFYPPHFHSSTRLISQSRILSSVCFQTMLFLKIPLTPAWWSACWRWCDGEWGTYIQVLPWSSKSVCVCNCASHKLLW